MRLLIRLAVNALALWVAFEIVPGLNYAAESTASIFVIAIIFGVANALVRPLLVLLTCPLIVLTLGLFVLIVNTIMLSLTIWLAGPEVFDLGLTSNGFWSTFLGAIVISIVSGVINLLLKDPHEKEDDGPSIIVQK